MTSTNQQDEEMDSKDLRQVLVTITIYYNYLVSRIKLIAIITVLGGGLGFLVAILIKQRFESSLSFVLSGDSKKLGFSSLAAQFAGVDFAESQEAAFGGENVLQLFRSRKLVERTLRRKLPNGRSLLNEYIESEGIADQWKKSGRLKNVFPFPDAAFGPLQDSLFRVVYKKILEEGVISANKADKKLIFYNVRAKSRNELVALYLPMYLVEETTAFYTEIKTKTAKENLRMIQREADSLSSILQHRTYSRNYESDQILDLNPALQVKKSKVQFADAQTIAIGAAYAEVLKNLEIAKINLQKETPLYQVIDVPTLPLEKVRAGKVKYAILFSFLAGLITMALCPEF